jgi:hypothetical protein
MAVSETLQETIHFEYISTDISIRQLSAKYGVSKSVLERMIKKGGWTIEKKNLIETAQRTARVQTETKTGQYLNCLTERAERVYSATDKLLALVDRMLENAEAMAPRDLQAMSSTLMNIKQLHDIKPETGDEDSGGTVEVRLSGELEDWAG